MQWCVLMQWDNSGRFYRAAARFHSEEAAREYGHNEYNRHPTMKTYKVEPAPEEGDMPSGS